MSGELYAVELERTQSAVIYVWAESPSEAREDAEELAYDSEWETEESGVNDTWPIHPSKLPEHASMWTGGPDGTDLRGAEAQAWMADR